MRYLLLNTIKRIVWSLHIQNQFLFKLSKHHQVIRITFSKVYPNINQFTFNSLLIKINSLKINSIKINSTHRRTKHTLSLKLDCKGFLVDRFKGTIVNIAMQETYECKLVK